jgi:hypothetical protein
VHDFGKGTISNFILADGFAVGLFWSDPQGASSNDYDLYMMSPNLDEVLDASTDIQDGSQDPFEIVGSGSGLRILVVRNDGAAVRALHVNSFRGILALRTPGQTHGHGSVVKAFSVAAVDVATAKGGPFVGGPTEPVETFSSDGPRRMFYNIDGSTVNGNVLFAGAVVQIVESLTSLRPTAFRSRRPASIHSSEHLLQLLTRPRWARS